MHVWRGCVRIERNSGVQTVPGCPRAAGTASRGENRIFFLRLRRIAWPSQPNQFSCQSDPLALRGAIFPRICVRLGAENPKDFLACRGPKQRWPRRPGQAKQRCPGSKKCPRRSISRLTCILSRLFTGLPSHALTATSSAGQARVP